MRYNIGMYGGSFDPLHQGHIQNIIRAAAICSELYVILSFSDKRDSVPKELRYRWLLNSFKHLENVRILTLEDNASTKEEYDSSFWTEGAQRIRKLIGKPIDVVFCGSDYRGTNRFESLYSPESVIWYFERDEIPVSSTMIRDNPLTVWEYIPKICRPYYTKKVLIIGSESSGKSTLCENLALLYNTNFVSEVGRDTCEYAGGQDMMIFDDMLENLLRQKLNVMEAAKESNRFLFVDTDAVTTLFYSNFLIKDSSELSSLTSFAQAIHKTNSWDLILFLESDVKFIQDGTRNEKIAAEREKHTETLKDLFETHNIKYELLSGDYLTRFEHAKKLIDEYFKLK